MSRTPYAVPPLCRDSLAPAIRWPWLLPSVALAMAVDPHIRFHLGDSFSYLSTSLRDFVPDDRSWTYGLAVSALIRAAGSLSAVVVAQIALLAGGLAVFASAAARATGGGSRTAAAILLACLFNPLAFYWVHAVMADAPALAAAALLCALATGLPRLFRPMLAVLAFTLFSLRVVYVPPVLAAAGTLALRHAWLAVRDRTPRTAAGPLAGFLACLLGYAGYVVANTSVLHADRYAANHASARFMVGAVSSVLTPEILAPYVDPTDRAGVLVPGFDQRLAATFAEHWTVRAVIARAGGAEAADPVFRAILRAVVIQRPLALARHVLRQWSDYLNPARLHLYITEARFTGATNSAQANVLDDGLVARLRVLGVPAPIDPDLPRLPSRALTYYRAGTPWAWLLAAYGTLAPLLLLAAPRARRTDGFVFMQVFAFVMMAALVAGSNELVVRYLLPLCLPLCYTAAAFVAAARAQKDATSGACTPSPPRISRPTPAPP